MYYSFAGFFKINENDIDMYKKLFNEYYNTEESKLKVIELLDPLELRKYLEVFDSKEQLKLIIKKLDYITSDELDYIIKYFDFNERLELNNIDLLTNEEIENNWSNIPFDFKILYFNFDDFDYDLYKDFIKNLSYEEKEKFIEKSIIHVSLLRELLYSKLDYNLLNLVITKISDIQSINIIWKYLDDNQKLELCKYHFVE